MRWILIGGSALSLIFMASAAAQHMGPGMMNQRGQWGPMGPWMMGNMRRHHQVMMFGIPSQYSSMRDPQAVSPEKLSRGAAVFKDNCAACHGPSGLGNGEAGEELVPPPANLQWLARMPISRSDPYMYWTIADGGAQFDSAMPAFKDSLPQQDIWAVVAYVREGLNVDTPR